MDLFNEKDMKIRPVSHDRSRFSPKSDRLLVRALLRKIAFIVKSVFLIVKRHRNITLRLILYTFILADIQAIQASELTALTPGQIIVEFESEHEINVYALDAKRIEILNQLSKYITLELIVENQLNDKVSIDISGRTLAQVLFHVLGDDNHLTWYRPKTPGQLQTTGLRVHEAGFVPGISTTNYSNPDPDNSINKKSKKDPRYSVEIIENLEDLTNLNSIRRLEKIINSADTEQKIAICNTLSDVDMPGAISLLARLMHDKNIEVRKEAIYALGDIDSGPAANVLKSAIRDINSDIRQLAISELALIRSDETVKALALAVKDRDPGIRITAVEALGDQNTDKANELLWKLTQSNDMAIAMAATDILTRQPH